VRHQKRVREELLKESIEARYLMMLLVMWKTDDEMGWTKER
jgi:hypothetical protein